MFERLGKKFMKGAKEELGKVSDLDWDKILNAAVRVAEAGLFAAVIFFSSRSDSHEQTPTIVINNYISKEDD